MVKKGKAAFLYNNDLILASVEYDSVAYFLQFIMRWMFELNLQNKFCSLLISSAILEKMNM